MKTYVYWARNFICYHDKRHLREMGAAEVERYLIFPATDRHVAVRPSPGVRHDPLFVPRITWARFTVDDGERPGAATGAGPVVLSGEETARLLTAVDEPQRIVREGKAGNIDRIVILPGSLVLCILG